MSELTKKQVEALQIQEQKEQLAKFEDVKAKILKAVDSIKALAIEQDWDINTFNVVMGLMNDACKRKVYNTKFSSVLEELTEVDPLVNGTASTEVHRQIQDEKSPAV